MPKETFVATKFKVGQQRKLIEIALKHKDRLKGKTKAERDLAEQQLRQELQNDPEVYGMVDPMLLLMAINVIISAIRLWMEHRPKKLLARRGRIEAVIE